MKNNNFFLIAVLAISSIFFSNVPASASEKLVEIMLSDKLDDARGYCLDIAGGKGKRAPLDKGLQAHTCYNYTGSILEDQGFVEAEIVKAQFRIAYFDVCMAVPSISAGAPVSLAKCNGTDKQNFELKSNGNLVTKIDPELCVTVSSTEQKKGRGGSPVHVMRPLSLQACDASNKTYQTWQTNSL